MKALSWIALIAPLIIWAIERINPFGYGGPALILITLIFGIFIFVKGRGIPEVRIRSLITIGFCAVYIVGVVMVTLEHWDDGPTRSEALLKRGRDALPDPPESKKEEFWRLDREFWEFLEHNEHEMALDMLEQMGLISKPQGRFWKDLIRAARHMGLPDRIRDFETEFDAAIERLNQAEQGAAG